ncbi:uncharacterized protein EV422DRAFT_386969 [Fimicolochytrium jonesii]|uniref:uncharacterized protein n=1 Tax=Fimicolochytrium jonesii TaxID=1396493 RepID=UPI0022FECDAE|nr:uncharacterized protein EV422DRAFT_386969 [Fimicolochytrium jonesii]KAI8822980.1 hypothetical protein EV422DRAFT_386969 [Fimicolochytrium jonesii]
MDSIKLPGFTNATVLHYNSRTSLIIQRARRNDNPNETVICKGNAFYDEEENIKLKHEYELLKHIHANLAELEASRTKGSGVSKSSGGHSTQSPRYHYYKASGQGSGSPSFSSNTQQSRCQQLEAVTEEQHMYSSGPTPPPPSERKGFTTGRRPRSTSLTHESIEGALSDRVIKPISVEDLNGQLILVLEDYGGVSLREFALSKPTESSRPGNSSVPGSAADSDAGNGGPKFKDGSREKFSRKNRQIGLEEFLSIATQLAEALEIVHAAQVMHKDINPDNIVVKRTGPHLGVQLIDFNLSEVTDMGNQMTRGYLEGTLAYMSPEQTGRMQRIVDYRTDFYSLGLTLWEVLVGQPPFQFEDATEYVHAHLAKEVESPRLYNDAIPQIFVDIVMRLASKAPETRYQSSAGLRWDLMQCFHQLQKEKASRKVSALSRLSDADVIAILDGFNFQVGQKDHSHNLNVPDKLYGREREMKELMTAYHNIATGRSRSELCLIIGSSGEGKSSLISHLRKHVIAQNGFFVHGQYSQYKGDRPYGGLVEALDMLIRQLLSEPARILERWQSQLTTSLGSNYLSIVTDVLPDLEMIVGTQKDATEQFDAQSAEQNSFIRAMQALIGVFAQVENPLVVFLDDLQYAEAASQKLLQAILFDKKISHLLIVATQPHSGGPLSNAYGPTVQRIQFEAPQRLRKIELGPLPMSGIRDILVDTLKPAVEDVDQLAALLYRKTMGNPFHIREFLRYGEQHGLLYFDDVAGGWSWDIQEMDRQSVLSDNVAELLLTRLRQFSPETQKLLQQGACIGDGFDLRLLSLISESSIVQLATDLWPAVKEGFILAQPHNEVLIRGNSTMSRSSSGSVTSQRLGHRSSMSLGIMNSRQSVGEMVLAYRFCHSRLHQACYNLMDAEERDATHLNIARVLRRTMTEEEVLENVFPVVSHYNRIWEKLTDPEERYYAARLHYEAGVRVKRSGSVLAARRMLNTAAGLLGDDSNAWDAQYELKFNTCLAIAQLSILEGLYDEAEMHLRGMAKRAKSTKDQLIANSTLVIAYYVQGRFTDIIGMGVKDLQSFQIVTPENEQQAEDLAAIEFSKLETLLEGRTVAEVASAPRCSDATAGRLEIILIHVGGAANSLGLSSQAQYYYLKGCVRALENGLGPDSSVLFAYSVRSFTSARGGPRFNRMRWLSELVFALLGRASTEVQARARLALALHGYVYVASFKDFEANIDGCITSGLESAHYSVLIYAMVAWPGILLSYGRPASSWRDWEERHRPFMEKMKGYFLNVWAGTMAELEALATGNECVYQRRDVMATGMSRTMVYYYRLVNAYLYDREDQRSLLEQYKQENSPNHYIGLPRYIDFYVFQALIAAREWDRPDRDRALLQAEIDEAYAIVKRYAEEPPSEIMCKFLMVAAEKERIAGNVTAARRYYDEALDSAHAHGFRLQEALTTELYGGFWLQQGSKRLARACLHDAYVLWYSWGSEGKCRHLQTKYPDVVDLYLLTKAMPSSRFNSQMPGLTTRSQGTEQAGSNTVDLDLTTVLKVTQSITNETSLETLLTKIIKFVMENAGAEKGLLVLRQDGKLMIEAIGIVNEGEEVQRVLQHVPVEQASSDEGVPLSVVYYVYRTREPIVLADASHDETYGKDPYIAERGTKSILCCPIMHQNAVTGVVYLENDLQPGAFTGDRLELIQSLMSAASMSIENAKLAKTNNELTAALKDSSSKAAPRYNLDGPIKKTIDMLQSFKFRLPPGDPGIKQIDFIMKALTSTDFFSSNIDEINDETGKGLDSDTKNWIENSLLQKEQRRSRGNDAKEDMFAAKNEFELVKHAIKADGAPTPRPAAEIVSMNMDRVNELLKKSTTADFNIHDLAEATNGRPLYFLGVHLLHHWGLVQHFSLDEMKLRAFFQEIEASYHPLPYHNSSHGADVLQTSNMLLLSDPKMAANFTKLEVFAACIASAVHDVDHPGLNNNFLVQSSHPLAIFYNDMSVLEFHHSAKAFEIARRPETNVFVGLSNEQYREARKLIISMVAATDMSQHFHYINKLKGKIAASALNWEEPSDRSLILECAIKCADLNNSAKPLEQSRKWAFSVMQEFFLQGDRERKLGMPVSKFMDRYDTHIPKCQIGFIDVLVVPLFDSWVQCIPTSFSRQCMDMIVQNRSHWESILDKPDAVPVFHPPPDEEREDFQIAAPSTPPFGAQPPSTHSISEEDSPEPFPRVTVDSPRRPGDVGRRMSSPHVLLSARAGSAGRGSPDRGNPVVGKKIPKSSSGGSIKSWIEPLPPPNFDKSYATDSPRLSIHRRSFGQISLPTEPVAAAQKLRVALPSITPIPRSSSGLEDIQQSPATERSNSPALLLKRLGSGTDGNSRPNSSVRTSGLAS